MHAEFNFSNTWRYLLFRAKNNLLLNIIVVSDLKLIDEYTFAMDERSNYSFEIRIPL